MGYTLEKLAADCHAAFAADSGPAGREVMREHLERGMKEADFGEADVGLENDMQRKQLYDDADIGFRIMAHVYTGAKGGEPHDHAGTWAIYGQAKGTTEMTEWKKLKAPEGDRPGLVQAIKTYELKPGMAVVYNEDMLHSPQRDGPTRLIRIEGRNLDGAKRDAYVATEEDAAE